MHTDTHTNPLKVARESAHDPEGCFLGWIRSQQPKALDIRKGSEASPLLLSQADWAPRRPVGRYQGRCHFRSDLHCGVT